MTNCIPVATTSASKNAKKKMINWDCLKKQIEPVANAIKHADDKFQYSFDLTRLVDGLETYTLSMPGFEPINFVDRGQGYAIIDQRRNRARADAVFAALFTNTEPCDDALFDVLEALKPHFPLIAGGFARGTGGVDLPFVLKVIRDADRDLTA